MMRRQSFLWVLLSVAAVMALLTTGAAQQRDADVDKALETVRADMRADKVAIVTEVMNLSPDEADKFWPVYREYETEVAKLNDTRIAILKDYAAKYTTLTDSEAGAMMGRFFDWETSRTQLRKTYFGKFMKATSATTAAKLFQVERRLDLVIDLQLAAEIPGLFMKPVTPSK